MYIQIKNMQTNLWKFNRVEKKNIMFFYMVIIIYWWIPKILILIKNK